MTAWATPIGAPVSPTRWDAGFLATLLRSDRLTLVFSPAGVERDSMLQRALIPLLGRRSIDRSIGSSSSAANPRPAAASPQAERRSPRRDSRRGAEVVIRFDGWGANPLQALREQVAAALPRGPDAAPAPTLAALLQATARQHDARLLLVFDGFERHLAISPDDSAEVRQFDAQLLDWLQQSESPARLLFIVDDASQDLLLRRYGASLRQLGRGWLRIRPEAVASVEEAPASVPVAPAAPATPPHARAADATFDFWQRQAVGADRIDIRAHDDEAAVAHGFSARGSEPPRRRWTTLGGAVLGLAIGLGLGVWLLARHGDVADRIIAQTLGGRSAADAARLATGTGATGPAPAVGPQPRAAVPSPAVLAPARVQVPAVAAPAPLTLEVTLPSDSGGARALIDELSRRVAAPAGIVLTVAASDKPAAAAILRADALPAAREPSPGAAPRRLLPVWREQVQVVVNADGRWRFLHQLRGAHLNVGEASGARAHTANALYRRLFGTPVPSWDIDRRDEASALRELLRDGSALDAVIVVSDRPALDQVPAAQRAQLRVLAIDPQHPSTTELARGFAMPRDAAGRGLLPQVTSYLVMADAASSPSPALQALACALGRAQPALQQQGSALLRGLDPRTSVPGGWTSALVPGDAGCPAH